MTLSGYQVDSVIKAYLRNMTIRATSARQEGDIEFPDDQVVLSEDAMKGMFFKRIRNNMTEKLRKRTVSGKK